jgi:DNA-binding CsgD family transcriptional regulator
MPAALIFLSDQTRGTPHAEALGTLYGLTPAEARLVCGLMDGLTLQEYADAKKIAVASVRTQLKSVFAKTGVNRQSALMRLILQNPVATMSRGSRG